jgi:hypothetical protein
MLDAHAHGAGDSPEWQPRWNELTETIERQRAAMKAAGQSTEEYDRNIKKDVRRFLKDEQHLSDSEIDARLAGAADPLDVVKPYLKGDKDARMLEENLRTMPADASPVTERTAAATPGEIAAANDAPAPPVHLDALSAAASLTAAGILVSETDDATHGLQGQERDTQTQRGTGSPT